MGHAGFDLAVKRIPGTPAPEEDAWEQAWGEILDDLETWIEARLSPDERGLFDIVSEVFEFRAAPPEETLDFLFGDWVPIAVFAGSHWYRAALLARAEAFTAALERAGYTPDLKRLGDTPDETRLYISGAQAMAMDAPEETDVATWEGSVSLESVRDQAALDALTGPRCPCGICAGR